VRTYGSQRVFNLGYGYGWDINYDLKVYRLDVDEGDPNIVALADGRGCSYEYTQDDSEPDSDPNLYLNPNWPGQYFYLDDVNDTFTLVKQESEDYGFDANDNLASITDEYGNSITFDYDANGLLTTITDTLSRDITLSYDVNDMLEKITDFAGRSWEYIYDSNDLVGVTGPNTTDYPNGLTTAYYYDEEHNLTHIIDPNEDEILQNYYEAPDRVHQQDVGGGSYKFDYDPDNNLTKITDRENNETRMVYNTTGQLMSETVYTADANSVPNSFTISYAYDANLLRTRAIYPEGNCIDYTYDDIGNITGIYRKTEPEDPNVPGDTNVTATLFTYDVSFVHKVKTVTDAKGNVTTYDYNDTTGVLEKITYPTAGSQTPVGSYSYNSFGQVTEVNSIDGTITKYEYYSDANDANNYGHLWKVIADYGTGVGYLNISTEFTYDVLGNVKEIKDPNGDTTQNVYNDLDQLTKITTPSPYNYVTKFSYDENGNETKVEKEVTGDPNQIISYSFNVMKKIESMTDPLGNVTTYGYNKNDEPNLVTDAEENDISYEYNERGLLCKVTDANGGETKYGYNDNGYLADINDPNGDVTSYDYDGFDRLIRITYPDDTNEVFGYDKNSNITSRKNRKGEIICYEYDALNRMTVKNRPGDPNITYSYDIAGRIVSVNDDGDITTYSYDQIGRVEEVNDVESRVVSYLYNDSGQRTKLTYPDNSYITYEYDAMGRLTYIKDEGGNPLAHYVYDELSRRKSVELGNGADVEYDYEDLENDDNLGNNIESLTNNFSGSESLTFAYTYDDVGNRRSMKIDDANAHVYVYDCLYQLTNVDYNDGSETDYYYDSLGNRTSVVNGGTTIYDSNCLNQYTSVGGLKYLYDKNGNLVDINDGEYEYVYGCENRLIEAKKNSQTVATYSYDFNGRRISKTVYGSPNVTTKYCYDGEQIIAEYNGSTLLRKFIYGPGIDEPICMIVVAGESETVYYYHFDGLGSVAALSDVNSVILERYSYDVFGEPNRVSEVHNPYMFTGRRYDTETGQYYYRARYYKLDIGRFLQVDPIGYKDGLNLYTYVNNNPIISVDPYGLKKKRDPGSCQKYKNCIKVFLKTTVYVCPPCNASVGIGHFLNFS